MKNSRTSNPTLCADSVLERPRYFPRQLITPGEMTLEQNYFRDRLRRHNRLLHGWGVVCGAQVCPVAGEPWKVTVSSGYILGPYGDEILIAQNRTVDLRTQGVSGSSQDMPGDSPDPWCSEVVVKRTEGPLYVAVRYQEVTSRPVRVQPASCGCDDTQCEYSRYCDGYEIGIIDTCGDDGTKPPDPADFVRGGIPVCPTCPDSPWVVLAEVDVDVEGNITKIDNCRCRRMVASLGAFWWRCSLKLPEVTGVDPAVGKAGEEVVVKIAGANFKPGARVDFGPGVTVLDRPTNKVDPGVIVQSIKVEDDATGGDRNVTVINPDCSTASVPAKFRVEAKPKAPKAGVKK